MVDHAVGGETKETACVVEMKNGSLFGVVRKILEDISGQTKTNIKTSSTARSQIKNFIMVLFFNLSSRWMFGLEAQ